MTKLAHKKAVARRSHMRLASGSHGASADRGKAAKGEPVLRDELRELTRHAYMNRLATPLDHPHT